MPEHPPQQDPEPKAPKPPKAPKRDSFSPFDEILARATADDPWAHSTGQSPLYRPDYTLFETLLTVPVGNMSAPNTGALANGVDSWLSHELRRAGFDHDSVWPRPSRPRILPRDISALLDGLPAGLAGEVRDRLRDMPAVAPTDAKILGRAYEKQVDVAIARWDRGPELLLSTKTQVSSFGKNLPNRFEEAYGDAGNLRTRYPLAAVGFFFLQRSTILDKEPDAFERTIDMMRKLRDLNGSTNGYTATGLALASWDEKDRRVTIELDEVPEDVRPEQFLTRMVEQVLDATSVTQHIEVRNRVARRTVPTGDEQDTGPSVGVPGRDGLP
ncbi:hypothetical protein [Janibacter sp. UYMM211]|uniref:hypothetical protein n=1 Tax=Janibacter sp. UYMM211 TaxID=3156342 RepID=UPI0033947E51